MSFSNNPFDVLGSGDQWRTVETRKQRRFRKSTSTSQSPSDQLKASRGATTTKSFTDQMLKEYSSKFQADNIREVCKRILSEVDEFALSTERENIKKRVVEEVGLMEQEAFFATLSASTGVGVQNREKDEDEEKEVQQRSGSVLPSDENERSNADEESLGDEEQYSSAEKTTPALPVDKNVSEYEEDDEDDVVEQEEHERGTSEATEEDFDSQNALPEEDSVLEEEPAPPPEKKTLAQILAEQAKQFDITTAEGIRLIAEWGDKIKQAGDIGREYRAAFSRSVILRTIVRNLLITTPTEKLLGQEETIELFHSILQGTSDYHEWLYNQIRKLADFICKTSRRTDAEWMKFLSNQAFALLDAQKEPDRTATKLRLPVINYQLPSTYTTGDTDERLKLQFEQSDTLCKDMYRTLQDLQAKDEEFMAVHPIASSEFKDRYTQIQSYLNQHISRAQALATAQTRHLESINEEFLANERRTKELIQPKEELLRKIKHDVGNTKDEIIEYENRLNAARIKLSELESTKTMLRSQIAKIQAAHHPQKADLTKQRNNCQFKLHSLSREQNCYTHLGHIVSESYKHLDSWSQVHISQELESRRALLQRFYHSVEKYVYRLFSIVNFLGQRVGYMQQALERHESECRQRKQFFGSSHVTMDKCIAADKEKMNLDRELIDKVQREVDGVVQQCWNTASKLGVFEQTFDELWRKIQSLAAQWKINLNSFITLKTYSSVPTTTQSLSAAMGNVNYSQHSKQHNRGNVREQHSSQPNQRRGVPSHQSVQPILQGRQKRQPSQTGGQVPPHTVGQSQPRRSSQPGNQQPLKIINNATNKNYDLHQQKSGGPFQNQPYQGQIPVTKSYSNSPPDHTTPPQGVETQAQAFTARRPGRGPQPAGHSSNMSWGRHYPQ